MEAPPFDAPLAELLPAADVPVPAELVEPAPPPVPRLMVPPEALLPPLPVALPPPAVPGFAEPFCPQGRSGCGLRLALPPLGAGASDMQAPVQPPVRLAAKKRSGRTASPQRTQDLMAEQ